MGLTENIKDATALLVAAGKVPTVDAVMQQVQALPGSQVDDDVLYAAVAQALLDNESAAVAESVVDVPVIEPAPVAAGGVSPLGVLALLVGGYLVYKYVL